MDNIREDRRPNTQIIGWALVAILFLVLFFGPWLGGRSAWDKLTTPTNTPPAAAIVAPAAASTITNTTTANLGINKNPVWGTKNNTTSEEVDLRSLAATNQLSSVLYISSSSAILVPQGWMAIQYSEPNTFSAIGGGYQLQAGLQTVLGMVKVSDAAVPVGPVATANPQIAENTVNIGNVQVIQKAGNALSYPDITIPDPNKQQKFPDVPVGSRPALAAYVPSSANWDFNQNDGGHLFLAQYHHRIITAGTIQVPNIGVSCVSKKDKGCILILINHFGDTADLGEDTIINGFTVSGRVWDMSTPEKTILAAQALLENTVYNMVLSDGKNEGANCSTIDGCPSVEWHVVIIGNGAVQEHWSGLYHR